jgi:hypothetical protein
MAKVASVNVDCATNGGAQVIWNLVSLLIANGWTLAFSSDNTGAAVTNAGSGAGGLNRASAYVVVQDPSGATGRKYLFQRAANDYTWLIRYARAATLTPSGTPNTVMPSSTDIRDLFSTNVTTNSGVATVLFNTTTNYFTHAVVETTPSFGVYQFWFAATVKLTGALQGGGYVTAVDTVAVSGGLDQDPSVSKLAITANWAASSNVAMWQYYGLISPAPAFSATGAYATDPVAIASVNAYTGKDDAMPVLYSSAAGIAPYKGQATWIRRALVGRGYPNTFNLNTDAYCYFASGTGTLLLPWPNGVTPSL